MALPRRHLIGSQRQCRAAAVRHSPFCETDQSAVLPQSAFRGYLPPRARLAIHGHPLRPFSADGWPAETRADRGICRPPAWPVHGSPIGVSRQQAVGQKDDQHHDQQPQPDAAAQPLVRLWRAAFRAGGRVAAQAMAAGQAPGSSIRWRTMAIHLASPMPILLRRLLSWCQRR